MLTMTITKKSPNKVLRKTSSLDDVSNDYLHRLNVVLVAVFVAIGIFLQVGRRLTNEVLHERVELGLLAMILFSVPVIVVFTNRGKPKEKTGRLIRYMWVPALAISVVFVGHRPVALYPYLWHGYGWLISCGALLISLLIVVAPRSLSMWITQNRTWHSRTLRFLATAVILFVYLPAFVQTSTGIINLGDASHQVLEEIAAPVVGNFPGINFVSTYTSLLGVPLVVLRLLALSNDLTMSIVLVWINILVLCVPLLLVLVVRRIFPTIGLASVALLTIAPILVSGSWGSAASNVESLSMIPGRSLGPVFLGFLAIRTTSGSRWWEASGPVSLGLAGWLVAVNNLEFGAGALVAVALLVTLESLFRHDFAGVVRFVAGVLAGVLSYGVFAFVVAGPLDYRFRIAPYLGKPYSPAEVFPAWSLHNLLLAVFVLAIALGVNELRKQNSDAMSCNGSNAAARAAIFFGLWGLLAFPYCLYRCVEGMYMSTQIYLIPAVICVAASVKLMKLDQILYQARSVFERLTALPFVFVASIGLWSTVQAPNPLNEWIRVFGRATEVGWAIRSDRPPANEWSTRQIDWIEVNKISEYAATPKAGYFGYMGNSVELATGLRNLTNVNSGEILQIKGSPIVAELACQDDPNSQIDLLIVLGIPNLCKFTDGFRFSKVDTVELYYRISRQ